MEGNKISVGLDIGTTKIVAMVGRKNNYGKLEILGIGKAKSLGVHRGVVNNITQTIQSIQQAWVTLLLLLRIDITLIELSLSNLVMLMLVLDKLF